MHHSLACFFFQGSLRVTKRVIPAESLCPSQEGNLIVQTSSDTLYSVYYRHYKVCVNMRKPGIINSKDDLCAMPLNGIYTDLNTTSHNVVCQTRCRPGVNSMQNTGLQSAKAQMRVVIVLQILW